MSLVAAINSSLPPGLDDFEPADCVPLVLSRAVDPPAVVEGKDLSAWIESELESIRRIRRKARAKKVREEAREAKRQAYFDELRETGKIPAWEPSARYKKVYERKLKEHNERLHRQGDGDP